MGSAPFSFLFHGVNIFLEPESCTSPLTNSAREGVGFANRGAHWAGNTERRDRSWRLAALALAEAQIAESSPIGRRDAGFDRHDFGDGARFVEPQAPTPFVDRRNALGGRLEFRADDRSRDARTRSGNIGDVAGRRPRRAEE